MVWCISRFPKPTTSSCTTTAATSTETNGSGAVIVNIDNYVRAQTDLYFANTVAQGGFGKLIHQLKPTSLDAQTVIRMNRDTLYTAGVFDLDAGDLTVLKPVNGNRFQSMSIINEDNSVTRVVNTAGIFKVRRNLVGTRYVMVLFRTFVDASSEEDIVKADILQMMIKVKQAATGSFDVPNWDTTTMTTLRNAINVLAGSCSNTNDFFGKAWDMNPIYHLMGTASGWGGSPKSESMYFSGITANNDGTVNYTLTLDNVPIKSGGFWSVTCYDSTGYMVANSEGQPSYNSVTATPNTDGSFSIYFGGSATQPNYIPIYDGWNYVVRCYLPETIMQDGCWTPPSAVEVSSISSD